MTTAAASRTPAVPRPPKAPWVLARLAQAAIAAAAVADVFRATAVREHALHPETPSGPASMIFVYLMNLAVVLFLVWLARVRRNAQALSPDAPLPDRFWTIVAWFIPVLNLVFPRGFLLAIGRASSPSWGRGTLLVNLWWAAWVGHVVVLGISGWVGPEPVGFVVASSGLMIVAAGLLGVVIQRVTALQGAALGAVAVAETA